MTTDAAAVAKAWVVALTVAAILVAWAVLARDPFPAPAGSAPESATASTDPALVALQRRERAVQLRAARVRRRHDARWAAYRTALAERQQLIRAVATQPAMATPSFTTIPAGGASTATAPAPATTTRSS